MDVLLADDNVLIRLFFAEAIAETGLQVAHAADPYEILDLCGAADPPSVLVTDVDLGSSMDGFGLAAAVCERWPAIRVVYISGIPGNLHGHHLRCSERFLVKPFTPGQLLQVIHEVTGGKWTSLAR